MSHRLSIVALAALTACAASAARADFSDTFESPSALTGWTTANGAATSTVQAFAGTHSLFIPATGHAIIPITGMSGGGVLTVEVFDQGNYDDALSNGATPPVYAGTTTANGWRVGVTPSTTGSTAGMAAVVVDQRTYFSSTSYAYSQGDGTPFGGFFSPFFNSTLNAGGNGPGTSREVVSLSPTPNDGSFGVGEWTKWEFDFDGAGNVSYFPYDHTTGLPVNYHYQSTVANTGGAMNSFFIYGGDSADIGGVYIDNVSFTAVPEPASLSLLGLAGTGLLLRRRRRA